MSRKVGRVVGIDSVFDRILVIVKLGLAVDDVSGFRAHSF